MSRLPWKDFMPAFTALIAVGVAWSVARGVLDPKIGGVLNAVATAAVAAAVAWIAWQGWRTTKSISGVELGGGLRSALIDRVRWRWIGVRDESGRLTGEGKLAQDLALGRQFEILFESGTGGIISGSAGWKEIWHSGHRVVLTGEPGSGKSVQLLLLAEMLLNDAERDPTAGVPVIVNLPAWRPSRKRKDRDRRFVDWLVAEINEKFGIPTEDSRKWLVQGGLIPILDGLDEVSAGHRRPLFDEVVKWVKDKEAPPAQWALGCRRQEYVELDRDQHLMGPRNIFWSVKSLSDEERIRFLSYAVERGDIAWQPVVNALRRGAAPHLTRIDAGAPGILTTPLGLTIAVEAYQPRDAADRPMPEELLDASGGWERLWARYVSHQYVAAHADPGDDASRFPRFGFEETRRWLATLASDEVGLGGEIDLANFRPPGQPGTWRNLWSFIGDLDALSYSGYVCGFYWAALFPAYGALVAWRGWRGPEALLFTLAIAVVCGLTLMLAGFPEFLVDEKEALKRHGFRYAVLGLSLGLPGLLVISVIPHWSETPVERILRSFFNIDGGWLEGALIGLGIAGISGLGPLLLLGLLLLDDFAMKYRRWMGRNFVLRWWYFGSPLGSRRPTGLVPHPRHWEDFLFWAAHRGFLRRLGNEYVWMHYTLRVWFGKYRDAPSSAAVSSTERPKRIEPFLS